MPGVLVAFHKGASIHAPLEGKRRGGWRVGVHSSLLMPWRGVGFGCRTGNEGRPKPLQTRRPRLANALLASQQARQSPQPKDLNPEEWKAASLPLAEGDHSVGPQLYPETLQLRFQCQGDGEGLSPRTPPFSSPPTEKRPGKGVRLEGLSYYPGLNKVELIPMKNVLSKC
ncbi:hypothetical protein GBF38_002070 [Nibea albiflora]|uniref:Uncharacterized protein n=1 Tax=Nibea albiflora TaxID=240163 RepID=A0ACB7ECT6_NIBAL|nr:hypothetical protein GBF38_002070 [Nibea albiflora]